MTTYLPCQPPPLPARVVSFCPFCRAKPAHPVEQCRGMTQAVDILRKVHDVILHYRGHR